jgi:hypothetical protein
MRKKRRPLKKRRSREQSGRVHIGCW